MKFSRIVLVSLIGLGLLLSVSNAYGARALKLWEISNNGIEPLTLSNIEEWLTVIYDTIPRYDRTMEKITKLEYHKVLQRSNGRYVVQNPNDWRNIEKVKESLKDTYKELCQ